MGVLLSEFVDNVLELIGNTPLVSLSPLAEPGAAQLLGKLESQNPGGSIKDRVALAMIEDAEARGVLRPGLTIVEPTAGNMGISLALVGTAKGYRVLIVMPESIPPERRQLVTRLGATVQFTPSRLGMEAANTEARRQVEAHSDYVSLDQFSNPANSKAHRLGTAQEILNATAGRVDAFVASVGTGGTITGVAEVLKVANPSMLAIAVEPASSPLLSQGWAGDHGILGIGADFIPAILKRELIDEVVTVTTEQAVETSQRLAGELGLLVGISSGANVFAALGIAQRLGQDRVVVTVLPDTGERYV